MNCPHCGAPVTAGVKFCASCGQPVSTPAPAAAPAPAQPVYQQPAAASGPSGDYGKILSPWAFFGYSVLFAIPIVGFIMLIVFSFSKDNICRRNFARSYFIVYIIVIVLTLIASLLGIGAGMLDSI